MSYDVRDFGREVLEASRQLPVLVDFWAEWCGPCRILGPILEKLAGEDGVNWKLAKVDVDAMPDIAAKYGIRGIPHVILFVAGAPLDGFVGALPEAHIRRWLERVVPNESEQDARKTIEGAKALLSGGKLSEARTSLEKLVAERPGHAEGRLELAKILAFEEPARVARLLRGLDLIGRPAEVAEALTRFAELFATLDAATGAGSAASTTVAASGLASAPGGPTYLEAIRFLRARDFAGAIEGFIAALRQNRELDDDGPRRAAVAIFKYLGHNDPLVTRYRSDLSAALY
jgi:putative thioredoxin